MAVVKLSLIILAIGAFFGIFVFGPFYSRVDVQIVLLILNVLGALWFTSPRETWGLIKFCIPFILTLLGFGGLFHLTRFLGRDDWMQDSLIKILIFPSSLIFLKILLNFITYLDLLRLPISMVHRIDLITFKAAFSKGGRVMARFKWYLQTYQEPPGRQGFRLISGRLLQKYACLIIALYLYLYEEIENSRLVMENRAHFLTRPPD